MMLVVVMQVERCEDMKEEKKRKERKREEKRRGEGCKNTSRRLMNTHTLVRQVYTVIHTVSPALSPAQSESNRTPGKPGGRRKENEQQTNHIKAL